MTDQPANAVPGPVCPWCSAALPATGLPQCPTCGAALVSGTDEQVPGLTAIDAGAIIRSRQAAIRPKSRLLSWLSGDDGDDVFTKAEGNALEPPEAAVRREMLRMELEAEVANLQAQNEAALAEAAAEGRTVELPPDLAETAESLVPSSMAGTITTTDEAPAADETPEAPEAPAPEEAEAPAAVAAAATDTDDTAEAPADAAESGTPPVDSTDKPAKKRR